MTTDTSLAVRVQDVRFRYGQLSVFNDLSISVATGTAYGLLGPNGAGKSTLMRLLAGRLHQERGEITVLGEKPHPSLTSQIGYMPQTTALYPDLTVRENVDFFARMYGISPGSQRKSSVLEALELVGLLDRASSPVATLSGGMRQRASLACALVHQPRLLLLDEPTVGLDPELRASFWDHFHRLAEDGVTLFISSHTMDDAAHCDHLAFLHGGHIIGEGTPDDLLLIADTSTLEDAFLRLVRGT